jgi:ADP-heptose:LPS heptosyltransferase
VGSAAEQLEGGLKGLKITDYTEELHDFGDTAALIEALDLVITVDTATAHLAGALGKPVWTMLWFAHCWRYLQDRIESPWYPSMRLFRQPRLGDWDSVVHQIARALKAEFSSPPNAGAP